MLLPNLTLSDLRRKKERVPYNSRWLGASRLGAGLGKRQRKVGAVIVHGFTSNNRAVAPLQGVAQALGMETELPLLRGHGGHYRDLRGCCWDDWLADLAAARARLRQRVDHVVLMGFSMGGLLALAAGAEHTSEVTAIVALAPALRIAHPLAPIAWMARGWLPFVPMGKAVAYSDPALAINDDSYTRLAIDAFCSFQRATHKVERALPRITAPLLIAHSRNDRVIRPQAAQVAFERVQSADKELVWVERSGHALLEDCDAPTVLQHVHRFLATRCG